MDVILVCDDKQQIFISRVQHPSLSKRSVKQFSVNLEIKVERNYQRTDTLQ